MQDVQRDNLAIKSGRSACVSYVMCLLKELCKTLINFAASRKTRKNSISSIPLSNKALPWASNLEMEFK